MKNDKKEPFLDRVLLHSKNADERLFDMILRFITFVILIIIVWIYADLAHAKADGLTLAQYYNIDFSKLTVSNENSLMFNIDDYIACLSEYTNISYDSNYHPPFLATRYATNHDFISEVIPDDCYSFYCYAGASLDGWYVFSIPRETIDNGIAIWTRNGFYATQDFTYYCGAVWYGSTVYPYYSTTFDSSSVHSISVDQYCTTDNCYFSNCPMWTGTRLDSNTIGGPVDYSSIISDAIDSDFVQSNALFNCNYFLYDNILKNPWDSTEDVESNLNHLYFEDVQIGLTGQASNQDITSAEVVVGVSVDDWVLNHINDYYVNISYNVHMKDSLTGSPDPDFTIHKIVPLKAFMNDGYVYSIYDLFQEGNFISYYNNIRSTYNTSVVSTDGWIHSNALVPTLLRNASYIFTDYFVRTVESQTANYSIFDFGLDVTVQLSAGALGGTGNMSYPYTKAFDFLNGSSSITSAEGLRNHNPWLGETTPQANPLVPQGNNDIIGGGGSYGGGNTNVSVNVSGQKIPMNVQTQKEMNDTLTNYTNAFTTFTQSIRSLADMESQNNFYAVLSNTVPMIPGVNIFLQYVALTCGVMLILLVLKILLF